MKKIWYNNILDFYKIKCPNPDRIFFWFIEAGTVFILSTIATSSIEEVAEAAPTALKWFQLYIYNDREVYKNSLNIWNGYDKNYQKPIFINYFAISSQVTRNLVKRAEKAGFKALVLTIDAPYFGIRRDDIRNKFQLPAHLKMANFEGNK